VEQNIRPDPKQETPRDKKYLDWLKEQPCAICDHPKYANRDVVAAHQSVSGRSMGKKGSDFEALPLCTFCHDEEGQYGVESTWKHVDRKLSIIRHLVRYIQKVDDHILKVYMILKLPISNQVFSKL
jgi:hypothetical protein